jgi:hypothetical protein
MSTSSRSSRRVDGGGVGAGQAFLRRGLEAKTPEEAAETDEEGVEEVECFGDNGSEEKEYHLLFDGSLVLDCVIIEPYLRC